MSLKLSSEASSAANRSMMDGSSNGTSGFALYSWMSLLMRLALSVIDNGGFGQGIPVSLEQIQQPS